MQAGHDVRRLGHGVDNVVGEVAGVGGGEADALQAGDLTAAAQQLAERAAISEFRPIGVHVLAEQGDLEHSVGDQRADLAQDVAGTAVLLLAAQAGHDAEGAGVVAADRDRDPGRVGRLPPGRQQRGEGLQRLGELGLRLVPDPGPLQQRGQRGHVVRAVDNVDPGRALGDPGALHLGQAAAHRDLHALLLLRQQVPQVAVQPVGRVLPDRAGVEHHHVGGLAVGGGLVSRLVEQAGQALGIVRVHLAPVGADLIGAAACCHTTRIGAEPGTQDSAAEPAIDCTRPFATSKCRARDAA